MNSRYLLAGALLLAGITAAVFVNRRFFKPAPAVQTPGVNLKVKGSVTAPVTLEVFSDFECPACRAAVGEVDKILAAHPQQVRVFFFHFPLSSHRLSPLAHQAAECAAQQGRFWPYHDQLYSRQNEWVNAAEPMQSLLTYARDEGMDIDRFAACLSDKQVEQNIQKDRQYGDVLRVSSTPTFFVNGQRFVGSIELGQGGAAHIRKLLGEKAEEPHAA